MSDWMQSNWYSLGSLLIQGAMLALLAWFGRRALDILGAAYGRSEGREAAPASAPPPEAAFAHSGAVLRVHDEEFAPHPELAEPAPQEHAPKSFRVPMVHFDLIGWLREPMRSGASGVAPWRRVTRWLQAPMGS